MVPGGGRISTTASLHPRRCAGSGGPEGERDAKSLLRTIMNESYKETLHQAKFSAIMDLELAVERSRSFRHMVSAIESLSNSEGPG